MPMNPTRYEYTPPVQIAGQAKDFTTQIDVTQTPAGWVATVKIQSTPITGSAAEAQAKLAQELRRLADTLQQGAAGK